jgi:hypothetical protein
MAQGEIGRLSSEGQRIEHWSKSVPTNLTHKVRLLRTLLWGISMNLPTLRWILEDNDPPEDVNGPQVPNETAARKQIFDSCEQVAAFIKRNRLSNKQTDEMLNLWKDDRLRIREVLETFKAHRDVDRYLMLQLVGEVSRNIIRLVLFSRLVSGSAYCCLKAGFNLHAPFVQEHHSAHPSCLELHCG